MTRFEAHSAFIAASKSLMGACLREIIGNKSSRYHGHTLIVLNPEVTAMEKWIVVQ